MPERPGGLFGGSAEKNRKVYANGSELWGLWFNTLETMRLFNSSTDGGDGLNPR